MAYKLPVPREYDGVISVKECEIEELKRQLCSQSTVHVSGPCPDSAGEALRGRVGVPFREEPGQLVASRAPRGKAPPVDPFTCENFEEHLDQWLASLEQACMWNEWSEE